MKIWIYIILTIISLPAFANSEQYPKGTEERLKRLRTSPDTSKVRILLELSEIFKTHDRQKAFMFAQNALILSRNKNYKLGSGRAHQQLASVHLANQDFPRAWEDELKALSFFQVVGVKRESAQTLNRLGKMFHQQKNYSQSLGYHLKALKIYKSLNDKIRMAEQMTDLSEVYMQQGNTARALQLAFHALAIADDASSPLIRAYASGIIGQTYLRQKDTLRAVQYHQSALDAFNKYQHLTGVAEYSVYTAQIYNAMNQMDSAESLALRAFNAARVTHSDISLRNSGEILYHIYKKKNDAEKALFYYELYQTRRDSIFYRTFSREMISKNSEYEQDRHRLQTQIIAKETDLKNLKLYGGSIASAVILLLSLGVWLNYRKRKQYEKRMQ